MSSPIKNKYYFRPQWIPTLVTIIVLPIFIILGFWQLSRAAQKQDLLDKYKKNSQLVPITLNQIEKAISLRSSEYPLENFHYRQIVIKGHFDNQHSFLIDNKIWQHQLGYQVITPFIVNREDMSPLLLINRGWLPAARSRLQLPILKPIEGQIMLKGIIDFPAKRHFSLGSFADSTKDWPLRVQYLDIKQMSAFLNHTVYPFIVSSIIDSPRVFKQNLAPVIEMMPSRHIAYAVQWFAFGGILLFLFIFLNIKKNDD